jgi:hypothetical protein
MHTHQKNAQLPSGVFRRSEADQAVMRDITFIIPLRAPQTCHSWERTSHLCNRTLASLRNQSHSNWQAILVCNQIPIGMVDDMRITAIEGDFPIPSDLHSAMNDKGAKKLRALEWLVDHPSRYAMLIDADDVVHSHLADFIARRDALGWIVAEGYRFYERHWPFLIIDRQFDKHCGTCYVLRVDRDLGPKRDAIAGHPLMRAHETIEDFFAQKGEPLERIPFFSVIQCCATNENTVNNAFGFSSPRSFLKLALRSRPLTKRLCKDFALAPLQP